MKQYLLFGGLEYYPDGGADDFIAAYDTLEEAMNFPMPHNYYEWLQVARFDGDNMTVEYSYDTRMHSRRWRTGWWKLEEGKSPVAVEP